MAWRIEFESAAQRKLSKFEPYCTSLEYGHDGVKVMNTVQLIEEQIQSLDNPSFAALRNWFIEYEPVRWDRQIASDAEAGKLDALLSEALDEHRDGKPLAL